MKNIPYLLSLVFLWCFTTSTSFAQQGDKTLNLILETGQSTFSHSVIMNYMESIELRLHYFGFSPNQVKVFDRRDKIHVEISHVSNPQLTIDLVKGTGDFKIFPIHKFDDEGVMQGLYEKLETLSMDIDGKRYKLVDLFELNATTMPGYSFRRYPPAVIGMAHGKDIHVVNQLLNSTAVKHILPANSVFIWAQKSSKLHEGQYDLYLSDQTTGKGLMGDHVARTKVYQEANRFNRVRDIIDLWLDKEGTSQLDKITKANTGRELIIVLNNAVISAPIVEGPIETGNLQIEGHFQGPETTALSKILKMKSLPGSPKVVSKQVE